MEGEDEGREAEEGEERVSVWGVRRAKRVQGTKNRGYLHRDSSPWGWGPRRGTPAAARARGEGIRGNVSNPTQPNSEKCKSQTNTQIPPILGCNEKKLSPQTKPKRPTGSRWKMSKSKSG